MRRIIASGVVLIAVAAFMIVAAGAGSGSKSPTYRIEIDDAFGLIPGADFKVAGVKAGKISKLDLDPKTLHAIVTVTIDQGGFGAFRSDAFCQSRPQSLIGEYYIECQPGQYGKQLKSGALIPVSHTATTISGDLVNDVLRLPYRERLTLLINELGAGVAGRSGDLEQALRRAVPALTETDNLLNLLGNDSQTLNQLNVNADQVITALANNGKQVQRFIDEANRAATVSATQQSNISATWHDLPAFLEQLKPALAQLDQAATTNLPVIQNLNTASGQLATLFRNLPGFAHASLPAIKALGQASVTGRQAATAATPTIRDLNKFARPAPELAQNLAIVLHDLDDRSRAVEADSRSPGGKGYTGLEAVLQYVFNQALAINTFGSFGHVLAVDVFVDPMCSPYADAQTLANNLAVNAAHARQCYAWLGPNQPGINEPDPSNPGACVPDPGGMPWSQGRGPSTPVCKLNANPAATSADVSSATPVSTSAPSSTASSTTPSSQPAQPPPSGGGGGSPSSAKPAPSPTGVLGGVLSTFGGVTKAVGTAGAPAQPAGPASSASAPSSGGQAQQLLNYLLAP